jgi:exodeoxyribonuclease VIII
LVEAQQNDAATLPVALDRFTDFLQPVGFKRVKVWGNGSDFDNAILSCCYGATGREVPWDFWHNRCYRTLKALRPGPKLVREGTYHNALDDAKSQALHAIELLR